MGYPTDEELRERHPVIAAISDANERDSDRDHPLVKKAEELQRQLKELQLERDARREREREGYFETKKTDDPRKFDIIEKAEHYNQGGVECIDALRAALGSDGFVAFCRGQAIKYAWRSPHKDNASQDLKKARYYLSKAIEESE